MPKPSAPPDIVVTHPEKLLFPEAGITKGEVCSYYRRIADRLLPYLRDRPVTLERLPEGVGEGQPHFWQKNLGDSYPEWIARIELPSEQGKPVHYGLVNDVQTLLYLVNQNTITFHVWLSPIGSLDRPDFVLLDLDRGEASFDDVVVVAHTLRRRLELEGVQAVVKTSGKSGLHVLTRWQGQGGHDEARAWARTWAERVVNELPALATLEIRKAKRGQRVYLDVTENAYGRHVVPPYCLRAVPTAAVSLPLSWRQLTARLDPAAFNLRTVFRRLGQQKEDPMAGLRAE
jgi:bifunctional non-homologous end joining protein LigD